MINKKIYFLLLIFLSTFKATAQPVVTSKNFPSEGTVVKTYSAESIHAVENKTGSDQLWDFSSLPLTFLSEVSYINRNKTNFSSVFSNANIAFDISDGEQSDYTYYDITVNHVKYLGFAANSSEVPVVAKYDKPWLVYALPLHFNDALQNQFSVNHTVISNGDTVNVFLKADYSYLVDGYGTLITPFGTYPNTLRIYSITNGRDSSIHRGTLDTTILNSYTTVKVAWISSDKGVAGEIMSTTDFKNFYFQVSSGSTGIQLHSVAENSIHIYPDPASEFINLEIPGMKPGQVSLNIYDNLGNLVKSDQLNNFSVSSFRLQQSVSDISPGFYFIKIKSGDGEWNSRFIRQ